MFPVPDVKPGGYDNQAAAKRPDRGPCAEYQHPGRRGHEYLHVNDRRKYRGVGQTMRFCRRDMPGRAECPNSDQNGQFAQGIRRDPIRQDERREQQSWHPRPQIWLVALLSTPASMRVMMK